jgi:hypothetical protein
MVADPHETFALNMDHRTVEIMRDGLRLLAPDAGGEIMLEEMEAWLTRHPDTMSDGETSAEVDQV